MTQNISMRLQLKFLNAKKSRKLIQYKHIRTFKKYLSERYFVQLKLQTAGGRRRLVWEKSH